MTNFAESRRWYEYAIQHTPLASQTASKAPGRAGPIEEYPLVISHGQGARVWDVDGREYLDFICGLAAQTLGHAHPAINQAIITRLEDGTLFGLPHPLEAEMAEKLKAIVPCAKDGMVRWGKSGSEATEAAVRIARIATGRSAVLSQGYHGWHSTWMAAKPVHLGVPDCFGEAIWEFQHNDMSGLLFGVIRAAFDAQDKDDIPAQFSNIAAIIIEPVLIEPPAIGYLEQIRNLCDKHGIVLIFDEMVTGFRWARAGGQEYFGVTPDLACYGKALSNGNNLACVCGKREIMEYAHVISGTFGGDLIGLSAAEAVLDIYEREPVIETIWARGQQFIDGFKGLIRPWDCIVIDGYPPHPRIRFMWDDSEDTHRMSAFMQRLASYEPGILIHPAGFNISAVMSEADIGYALDCCARALQEMRDGAELVGEPYQQGLRTVA